MQNKHLATHLFFLQLHETAVEPIKPVQKTRIGKKSSFVSLKMTQRNAYYFPLLFDLISLFLVSEGWQCCVFHGHCVAVACCCCLCQGEANIGSVEEFGQTVLVTEKRSDSRRSRSGLVVIRVSDAV